MVISFKSNLEKSVFSDSFGCGVQAATPARATAEPLNAVVLKKVRRFIFLIDFDMG
jgi:hypothetical protein